MNLLYCLLYYIFALHTLIQAELSIQHQPSQNFDQRQNKQRKIVAPNYIIIHYTANCDKKSTLKWLKNIMHPVSAHYIIEPNGSIIQTVDPENRAWHAGESSWKDNNEMNTYSIGIELVNPGFTTIKTDPCPNNDEPWNIDHSIQLHGSDLYWYPFTKAQIQNLIELCQELMQRYHIKSQNVLGHSDIAPYRKTDPGPLFPWKLLANNGIGIWYKNATNYPLDSIQRLQTMLKEFGYKIKVTDKLDKQTHQIIKAFQMHFRPTKIDGNPDDETVGILSALLSQT